MIRPLGTFERAEVLTGEYAGFNGVVVVRLSAAPRPEILEETLRMLQARHPLLSARVELRGGKQCFTTGTAPAIPLSVVERDGEDRWVGVVEQELLLRFDLAAGPPARCALVASSGTDSPAEIVLAFHHAVIDAASGLNLLRELLALCARLDAGDRVAGLPPLPLLPPVEDLFPPALRGWGGLRRTAAFMVRQAADEVGYSVRTRGLRSGARPIVARCRILSMSLPEEGTAALIRRCRRERVSVNSALTAALLLEVWRRRFQGREVPLRTFVFPNLRPYLVPPVPDENLGSYYSMLRITVAPPAGRDSWEFARGLTGQVLSAARRGEKFLACLMSETVMRMMVRTRSARMADTALSYTGVARLEPAYGRLRVRGLHAFITNFPLGPEYTAQARILFGRLWWDILYLDTDMDDAAARAIADGIRARLQGAAGDGGTGERGRGGEEGRGTDA